MTVPIYPLPPLSILLLHATLGLRTDKAISPETSLNSPNSGIGLFYAESGFFDGNQLSV